MTFSISGLLTVYDICLIAFLCFGVAIGMVFLNSFEEGTNVLVTLDGKQYTKASILNDRLIEMDAKTGTMFIEISNGKVRVSKATCQSKICLRQGWISKTGQVIVCVPNKLIIELNSDNAPSLDAVTG